MSPNNPFFIFSPAIEDTIHVQFVVHPSNHILLMKDPCPRGPHGPQHVEYVV